MRKKYEIVPIGTLLDKKLVSAERGSDQGQDIITFKASDGTEFVLTHFQDCCEDVCIADIDQPLTILLNGTIVMAEESFVEAGNFTTYSFYKIGSDGGGVVTIQWRGESNGYYNEKADFAQVIETS